MTTLNVASAPSGAPSLGSVRGLDATTLLAAGAVVLVALRIDTIRGVSAGTIVALALAPLWARQTFGTRRIRGIVAAVLVCLPVGAWMTAVASADRTTSVGLLIASSVLLVNLAMGATVVFWARTYLSDPTVAILYAVGLAAHITSSDRFADNPWRFGFSIPVTVLALALAWRSGRRWLEVMVALTLAGASAVNGGRSTFAMLFLAATITAWSAFPRHTVTRGARVRTAVLGVGLVFALYQLGQGLILDGYLGEDAQQRTAEQISQSGSVLLGARPELGATGALVAARPMGFGSGVIPSVQDVMVAKSGMAELGYDPNNGYVERYMFGSGFELHSVVADLWVAFGVAGVVLGLLIGRLVVLGLAEAVSARAVAALAVYLGLRTLWDLGFGPIYSALTLLCLTIGLLAPHPRGIGGPRSRQPSDRRRNPQAGRRPASANARTTPAP